jgi:hypothetical protein
MLFKDALAWIDEMVEYYPEMRETVDTFLARSPDRVRSSLMRAELVTEHGKPEHVRVFASDELKQFMQHIVHSHMSIMPIGESMQ